MTYHCFDGSQDTIAGVLTRLSAPGWDIFLISNIQASSMVHLPSCCSVKLTLESECSYIFVPYYKSSWQAQGWLYLQIFTMVFLNKQVLFTN